MLKQNSTENSIKYEATIFIEYELIDLEKDRNNQINN